MISRRAGGIASNVDGCSHTSSRGETQRGAHEGRRVKDSESDEARQRVGGAPANRDFRMLYEK